jgi:hypothetical protein
MILFFLTYLATSFGGWRARRVSSFYIFKQIKNKKEGII